MAMNSIKKTTVTLSLVFLLCIMLTPLVSAATDLISPIPNQPDAGASLSSYLKAIFNYGIGLAALIAMAQLIFGAVQYTTSAGAPSLREDAKSRMRGAIIGLILLLLSITVLAVISNTTFTGGYSLSPELEKMLNAREQEAKRSAANATEFRDKTVAETLALSKDKRADYLLDAATRSTDVDYFTKTYPPDSVVDALSAYQGAFRDALKQLKLKLSAEDFASATSKINADSWLKSL